jgi:hypothetical protein
MSSAGPQNDVSLWARVSRLLPQSVIDAFPGLVRAGRYGEIVAELVNSKSHKQADEGSQFLVTNPTPSTGIATGAAVTSFTATTPYIVIQNNNPIGGKNIFLDYIKLTATVAGTNGVGVWWRGVLDNLVRYTSGGAGAAGTGQTTVLSGPVCPNFGSPAQSNALVYAGAITAAAASSVAKLLSGGVFRTTIMVVGDTYTVNFGGAEASDGNQVKNGTNPTDFVHQSGPVEIAPGGSYLFYLWSPSQTVAAQNEVEISYVER